MNLGANLIEEARAIERQKTLLEVRQMVWFEPTVVEKTGAVGNTYHEPIDVRIFQQSIIERLEGLL